MKPRFQNIDGSSVYNTLAGFDFAAFAPCKIPFAPALPKPSAKADSLAFTCPDPLGIRGSSFPFHVSTQSHPTAHSPARCAPICTYVQLRAPACAKTKNFQNGAQTAHNRTSLPIPRSASRSYRELTGPIGTYRDHKNVKTLFLSRDFCASRTEPDKSGRKGGRGSKSTPDNQRLTQTLRTPS